MAQGYQLIQAQTLSSTAASVTFSNIPQNYNDLIIKVSTRSDRTGSPDDGLMMSLNGSTSNFTHRGLEGNGSNTSTFTAGWGSAYSISNINGPTSTANTFSNNKIYISNYTSSNFKIISSESAQENNQSVAYIDLFSDLWSNTAAITTISFSTYSTTNFQIGTTFSLYGIGGTRATGGTITADGNYTYHTFTSTGSFIPSEKIRGAEILLVAGGGASAVGGGGAGGLTYSSANVFNAGTSYTAIVGAGGSAPADSGLTDGSSGNNSQFSSTTIAIGGGGGGGKWKSGTGTYPGVSGGSGGGGCSRDTLSVASGGTATSGQGNAGGTSAGNSQISGGGGGGFNSVGGNTASNVAGSGGNGTSSYSSWGSATNTGENVSGTRYYSGGGAGVYNQSAGYGIGGLGGGGSTGAGTANTGGGGAAGGAGGSGLVIIRYPNN